MDAEINASSENSALIAEQFAHLIDLLKAETQRQAEKIRILESQVADFETRIRELTTSATQFKFLAALATGGGFLSIISLIKIIVSP